METDNWLAILGAGITVLLAGGAALWTVYTFLSRRMDTLGESMARRLDEIDSAAAQRAHDDRNELYRRIDTVDADATQRVKEVHSRVDALQGEISHVRRNTIGAEQFNRLHDDLQAMSQTVNQRIDQVLQLLIEYSKDGRGGKAVGCPHD